MLVGYGVGDHRLFVVDFVEGSLIGKAPFRIKRFNSQQLNTQYQGVHWCYTKTYLSRLEDSLDCRHLIERFGLLHTPNEPSADGLNMLEVVGDYTGKKIGPTFF